MGPRGRAQPALVAAGHHHLGGRRRRRRRRRGRARPVGARHQRLLQDASTASRTGARLTRRRPHRPAPHPLPARAARRAVPARRTARSTYARCGCTPAASSGTATTCTSPAPRAASARSASTTSCGCPPGDATGCGCRGDRVDTFGYRYVAAVAVQLRRARGARRTSGCATRSPRWTAARRPTSWSPASTAAATMTTRLARYEIDPATSLLQRGRRRPLASRWRSRTAASGACRARWSCGGTWFVTTSRGQLPAGQRLGRHAPATCAEHRCALPVGPEDITYWPSTRPAVVPQRVPRAPLRLRDGPVALRLSRRLPSVAAARASWRDCATSRSAESQTSASSSSSPPATLRVECVTRSQPGAGTRAHVDAQLQRRRPAEHAEVEGDRRQRVDGEQQHQRVGLAAVGHPQPALDQAAPRRLARAPSRRSAGSSRRSSRSRKLGLLHERPAARRSVRHAASGGGRSGGVGGGADVVGQRVEVAVRRQRPDPLDLATVLVAAPARPGRCDRLPTGRAAPRCAPSPGRAATAER